MGKTIHVVPSGREWTVKSSKADGSQIYPTRRKAVVSAKLLIKKEDAGQVVVYGRDGKVTELDTYGMPAIQASRVTPKADSRGHRKTGQWRRADKDRYNLSAPLGASAS